MITGCYMWVYDSDAEYALTITQLFRVHHNKHVFSILYCCIIVLLFLHVFITKFWVCDCVVSFVLCVCVQMCMYPFICLSLSLSLSLCVRVTWQICDQSLYCWVLKTICQFKFNPSFSHVSWGIYLSVFFVWKPTEKRNFDASSMLIIAICSASLVCEKNSNNNLP